jgi:hypothetical protein
MPQANIAHPDSYYEYDLVGVLVHSGTSEAGHYYSFIKDREKGEWFEFNDTRVLPFELSRLKYECFGGENAEMYVGSDWYQAEADKHSRNAYILFYERAKCVQPPSAMMLQMPAGNPPNVEIPAEPAAAVDETIEKFMKDSVRRENIEFMRNRLFYELDYFNFVKEFIGLYHFPHVHQISESLSVSRWGFSIWNDHDPNLSEAESLKEVLNQPAAKMVDFALIVAFETLIKIKDYVLFKHMCTQMREILERYEPGYFILLNFLRMNVRIRIQLPDTIPSRT